MLNVKTGLYHPYLERAFLNDIVSLKKNNPIAPVAVVAPSSRILERLQQVLAESSDNGFAGIDFYTFFSLALNMHTAYADSTQPVVIDSLFFEEVVLSILTATPHYKNENITTGLPHSVLATLRDLIESGIKPDDLLKASSEGFLKAEPGSMDIFKLYTIYQEHLRKLNILTGEELIKTAAAYAPDSPLLARYTHILYYGFYDLNGIQADFFTAVAGQYPCTLYFPYRAKHPAFEFIEPFYKSVILGNAQKTESLQETPKGDSIHRLSDTTLPPLRFFDASGRQDEAWYAAKEILRLTEQKQYAFADIIVSARSLEEYGSFIKEVFTENRIPYTSDTAEPLTAYPLTKTVKQLLSLFAEDFPRAAAIDVLKSPYFNICSSPKDIHPAPSQWDMISRRLGIYHGWDSWQKYLTPWTKKDFPLIESEDAQEKRQAFIPAKQTALFLRILDALHKDFNTLAATGTYTAYAEKIAAIITDYLRLPDDATEMEMVIFNKITDTIETIKAFDLLGEKVTITRFLEIVNEKIDKLRMNPGTDNIKGVRVLDAMAARGMPCRILFIMGLNEKSFPRIIREDPFLRDSVRGSIYRTLGAKLDEKLNGYKEEILLFYLLMHSAGDRIYLSWQRADEDGRPLIPSTFLRELTVPDKTALPRRLSEKLLHADTRYLTPKELSVRSSLESERSINTYFKQLGEDTALLEHSRTVSRKLCSWDTLLPFDGITGELPDYNTMVNAKGFSPTSLETAGRCPFKYFADKVLDIAPLEEPQQEQTISKMELGRIFHKTLHVIYRDIASAKNLRTFVKEKVDSVLGEYESNPIGLYPLVWETVKKKVHKEILDFVSADSSALKETGFSPAHLEQELSSVLGDTLPETLKQVLFHGFTDRVDTKKEHNTITFKIIDYKYKEKKKGLKLETSMLRGENLQFPLYLKLVEHMLKKQHGSVTVIPQDAAMYYLRRSPGSDTFVSDSIYGTFWETLGADFSKTLDTLINIIYTGRFFITPGRHCDWCQFTAACRKNHQPSVKRRENDALTNAYDEIKTKKASTNKDNGK